MSETNDDSTIYVDDETWEWLQRRLEEPPRVDPEMVELLRRTRGTIKHVDPEADR